MKIRKQIVIALLVAIGLMGTVGCWNVLSADNNVHSPCTKISTAGESTRHHAPMTPTGSTECHMSIFAELTPVRSGPWDVLGVVLVLLFTVAIFSRDARGATLSAIRGRHRFRRLCEHIPSPLTGILFWSALHNKSDGLVPIRTQG
jgi:hypothetical protein